MIFKIVTMVIKDVERQVQRRGKEGEQKRADFPSPLQRLFDPIKTYRSQKTQTKKQPKKNNRKSKQDKQKYIT